MKAQACYFTREGGVSTRCKGIAILNSDFNCKDVKYIIDENGNQVEKVFDYSLIYNFLSCISTDFN